MADSKVDNNNSYCEPSKSTLTLPHCEPSTSTLSLPYCEPSTSSTLTLPYCEPSTSTSKRTESPHSKLDVSIDEKADKVPSGQRKFTDIGQDVTNYKVGDIVWAKIWSYPFWPSIICSDPVENTFIKDEKEKYSLHVRFCNDSGQRSWSKNIEPYSTIDALLVKYPKCLTTLQSNKKKKKLWNGAIMEAQNLLSIANREERLIKFASIYNLDCISMFFIDHSIKATVVKAVPVTKSVEKPTNKPENVEKPTKKPENVEKPAKVAEKKPGLYLRRKAELINYRIDLSERLDALHHYTEEDTIKARKDILESYSILDLSEVEKIHGGKRPKQVMDLSTNKTDDEDDKNDDAVDDAVDDEAFEKLVSVPSYCIRMPRKLKERIELLEERLEEEERLRLLEEKNNPKRKRKTTKKNDKRRVLRKY